MGVDQEVDLHELVRQIVNKEVEGWAPQPGPQFAAMLCPAYEMMYGGAAGGGKTDYTLAEHLKDALLYPFFKGVIFRRSYPELDEVIQRARWFFPTACPEVKERDGGKEWVFPNGARVLLRHLQDYKAATAHKSSEYTTVTFEELTTFEERQYLYLHTRARSSKGVPIKIRSTTNPGGLGHEWVFKRFGPWLDPKYKDSQDRPLQAKAGEVLWFISGPKSEDIWVPEGTPGALSRTFIPAKLSDNKVLTNANPLYEAQLNSQDPLTRAQLKDGNWLKKASPKTYFNRDWCPVVEAGPKRARRCRGWDRASTEFPTPQYPDPDWTAGVKLAYSLEEDLFYIEHVERKRLGPGGVKNLIVGITKSEGLGVEAAIPCDPAQAGGFEVMEYLKALKGFVVNTKKETGDKVARARAWSSHFEPQPGQSFGKFRIVRGPWNEAYLSELEEFPGPGHDDQVDATSTAFQVLAMGGGCEGEGGLTTKDMLKMAGIVIDEGDDDDERPRGSSSGYRW